MQLGRFGIWVEFGVCLLVGEVCPDDPLTVVGNGLNVVKVCSKDSRMMKLIKAGDARIGHQVWILRGERLARFDSLLIIQGARRIIANLEGHGDPKSLSAWSQFFSAGIGGVISQ